MKTNIIVLLFVVCSFNSFSQDFYDHDNSVKFGKYLYNSNQLDLAVREFERCVFLRPDDRESFLYILKINRKLNAFELAVNSLKRYNGNKSLEEVDLDFGTEYFKLLIQNKKYQDAALYLDRNPIFKDHYNFKLSTILLKKEWQNAKAYENLQYKYIDKTLANLTDQGMKLKRKSPWLAGLLSTIIPGSGKIYAGRWKDGLIALFMTSSTAFVSIKGFQNDHHKFYPWALGTIAAVYYSGNIYGSSQAAKKYNEGKEDALSQKAYDYILSDN